MIQNTACMTFNLLAALVFCASSFQERNTNHPCWGTKSRRGHHWPWNPRRRLANHCLAWCLFWSFWYLLRSATGIPCKFFLQVFKLDGIHRWCFLHEAAWWNQTWAWYCCHYWVILQKYNLTTVDEKSVDKSCLYMNIALIQDVLKLIKANPLLNFNQIKFFFLSLRNFRKITRTTDMSNRINNTCSCAIVIYGPHS